MKNGSQLWMDGGDEVDIQEACPTNREASQSTGTAAVSEADRARMLDRQGYSPEVRAAIERENLLPTGLLSRAHACYPQHSTLLSTDPFLFPERRKYSGVAGFRDIVSRLAASGIHLGDLEERELFIEVYRFMATRHVLNAIDWRNLASDSLFALTFPQPGMMPRDVVEAYRAADGAEARARVARAHLERTNPHDGKQRLNRPWFDNDRGEREFLEGSQHKYPQCQLVFDRTTQDCFAFCTYCFRHAQVRGDEDMFLQQDVAQVHRYLRRHPEVTDLLITGGDAGFMPANRFAEYALPIISDPALLHVRTIRFASRVLSYAPEVVLSPGYRPMLELFRRLSDNGIQLAFMAHFSTPRELLHPSTIAAIRRLQHHGVTLRSQSPIMNRISLFLDERGEVDVDRTARNWIDLGNLLAMLRIGFHSMYCARPTGEHHYFTAPLAVLDKIYGRIHRSLASISRPSRYLSMTTSAGKISILGTTIVGGRKAFALKFTQARNMAWLDRVFLARYDEKQNNVDLLEPFDTPEFFFREELREIERSLAAVLGEGEARCGPAPPRDRDAR